MKRTIAISLLALAVAAGCGKKDEDKGAGETPAGGAEADQGAGQGAAAGGAAAKKELPPPPKDAYQGKGRIVNLRVDKDGKTGPVDVWAKRSFKHGPVLLAEKVGFGEASDWFGVPKSMSVSIVPAGAGADAEGMGGIFGPKPDEHITGVLVESNGRASVGNHWETGAAQSNVPAAPADGKGMVVVRAGQLRAFEDALRDSFGGSAFYVGTGAAGDCLPQRMEAEGKQPAILGGTNPTVHDVDPGKVTLSFHKWPSNDKCGSEPVFTTEVEVAAGEGVNVYLYTADGAALKALAVPRAIPSAAAAEPAE
jgi:hypothetical protein